MFSITPMLVYWRELPILKLALFMIWSLATAVPILRSKSNCRGETVPWARAVKAFCCVSELLWL